MSRCRSRGRRGRVFRPARLVLCAETQHDGRCVFRRRCPQTESPATQTNQGAQARHDGSCAPFPGEGAVADTGDRCVERVPRNAVHAPCKGVADECQRIGVPHGRSAGNMVQTPRTAGARAVTFTARCRGRPAEPHGGQDSAAPGCCRHPRRLSKGSHFPGEVRRRLTRNARSRRVVNRIPGNSGGPARRLEGLEIGLFSRTCGQACVAEDPQVYDTAQVRRTCRTGIRTLS